VSSLQRFIVSLVCAPPLHSCHNDTLSSSQCVICPQNGGCRVCEYMHARSIYKKLTQGRTVQRGWSNPQPLGKSHPASWQLNSDLLGTTHEENSSIQRSSISCYRALGHRVGQWRNYVRGAVMQTLPRCPFLRKRERMTIVKMTQNIEI